MNLRLLTSIAASAVFLAACSDQPEQVSDASAPLAVETVEAETNFSTAGMDEPIQLPTMVDILGSSPDFSTLVSALGTADLIETLYGPGPFTIFAPTNEAFAAMDNGMLEELMKPENKGKLITVLSYHVIPGKVSSGDIAGKSEAVASLNNKDMLLDGSGVSIKVNTATVTMGDIEASNGLIHVVDQVLVPRFSE